MNKYFGKIGFAIPTETAPGVWKDVIVQKDYYGDFNRNHMRPKNTEVVNDDIVVQNEISIISDPFAVENFHTIRYATFIENPTVKWKVTSVDVQYPRLILTLGSVYNG